MAAIVFVKLDSSASGTDESFVFCFAFLSKVTLRATQVAINIPM